MLSAKRSLLVLSMFAWLALSPAQAKTVSFFDTVALQNNGSLWSLLVSPNQLVNPTVKLTDLTFATKLRGLIPDTGSATLIVSALVMGNTMTQTIALGPGNYVSTLQSPFYVQFGFSMPRNIYHPTPVTLTIQLVNSEGKLLETKTYNFMYVAPVPEPATLALVGIGLVGISGAFLRKFRQAA